ncbi:hypothetical protein C2S52_018484 [Perilla frutescens var. hirtella]|nr:hypothetical protein C2S52_018484 [Perilla frutescens var. hirtella]KAH6812182.1 hypothetical protein C2S51_025944 [Perilla frutescens var. frutescens]
MEENQDNREVTIGTVLDDYRFWAGASAAQLGWGFATLKRGYAGTSHLMPLKAFAVASLFVGAAASCVVSTLKLSGIRSVEDLKTLGEDIRNAAKNTR